MENDNQLLFSSFEIFEEEDESTSLLNKPKTKNYELFKAKLVYLFYYGASGSMTAYLPVYYKQLNMNEVQVGILASLLPICRFFGAPIWGAITDRTGSHRGVLLTAVAMYTILVTLIYPLSLIENNVSQVNQTIVTTNVTTDCVTTEACVTSGNHSIGIPPVPLLGNQAIFWILFVSTSIAFLFMSTIGPIMDGTVITMGTNVDYGNPRLWGAFGFGFFGFLSGFVASDGRFEGEVTRKADFLWSFIMFLVLNTFCFIACLTLRSVEGREPTTMVTAHLKSLATNAKVVVFMLVVLIMGISSGVITWLMFIFLKDLGASQSLLGISIAVYCASEVVIFALSGKMIRYLGNNMIFFIALIAFIVRLMSYSYLENPWLVLTIEPLHGFTFAAMWSSCVSYASKVSPPEVTTTVIGLVTGVHFGLGWGLGATLGGVVYQYYGPRVLFRSCAVMCGLGMVLHGVSVLVFKRRHDDSATTSR